MRLIVEGFQLIFVSCAANILAPRLFSSSVIATISRLYGFIVLVFLERSRKWQLGWWASHISPHGRLLRSWGSVVCKKLGSAVPGCSSEVRTGVRGVAGGVFVVSGGVSCDMIVIGSTLVGEAVFVGVACRGKNPWAFVVVEGMGDG